MNQLESLESRGLALPRRQPATDRLAQLRLQRELRRQRARWVSAFFSLLALAFVVQGFVAQEPAAVEPSLVQSPQRPVRSSEAKPRVAQPKAVHQAPSPH